MGLSCRQRVSSSASALGCAPRCFRSMRARASGVRGAPSGLAFFCSGCSTSTTSPSAERLRFSGKATLIAELELDRFVSAVLSALTSGAAPSLTSGAGPAATAPAALDDDDDLESDLVSMALDCFCSATHLAVTAY